MSFEDSVAPGSEISRKHSRLNMTARQTNHSGFDRIILERIDGHAGGQRTWREAGLTICSVEGVI